MSSQQDHRFTPFNFSDVTPFDSVAAALGEIPTLHISEPVSEGFGFAEDEIPTTVPSAQEQTEILAILSEASVDGEWRELQNDVGESHARGHASGQRSPTTSWINSFNSKLTLRLSNVGKHSPSPRKPNLKRSPPKRPRPPANVITISDSEEEQIREATPPPQTPEYSPEEPMQRTSLTPQDVHQRELRMQQLSKDVDLDELREFTAYLQKFVRRVQSIEDSGMHSEEAVLKATSNFSQMNELRERVVLAVNQSSIPGIPSKLLQNVVSLLDTRIEEASIRCSNIKDVGDADNVNEAGDWKARVSEGILGLVAAQIVLSIIAAPNSPRFLLVEERLEGIVSLLRNIATNLIYPAFDPIYQASKAGGCRKSKSQNPRSARKQKLGDNATRSGDLEAETPVRHARRTAGKKDELLHDACCSLLDTLSALFRKEQHLPDSVVSHCASLCIQCFSVTGIERMHVQAMKTTCSIFSSYRGHRLSIMDEVREAVSVVPANRRHLRCFQIAHEHGEVRVTSALLAQLLCIASTDEDEAESRLSTKDGTPNSNSWVMLRQKRHDRAVKMAGHVLEPLLNRWNSDREPEYRTAFQTLFEDILALYGQPEWPSAELMLQTLSVAIIQKMRTTEEKSALLKSSSFDILGPLAAKMCDFYGKQILQEQHLSNVYSTDRNEELEEEREVLLTFLGSQSSIQHAAARCFYEALFVADDVSLAMNHRDASKRIAGNAEQLQEGEDVIDGQDAVVESNEEIYARVEKDALRRTEKVMNKLSRREHMELSRALQASQKVGMNRSFARGFRRIIDAILDGTRDTAPTVRTKSIKALAIIDESCPSLFQALRHLFQNIEGSCRDVSALARDAALDFLSRFLEREMAPPIEVQKGANGSIDQDENVVKWILSIVEKRLLDTSTAVRKRAVTIMGSEMLRTIKRANVSRLGEMKAMGKSDKTKLYEDRIIRICIGVVARMDDTEASVKDAAERTVRMGLFGFDVSQRTDTGRTQTDDAIGIISERLINIFSILRSSAHATFLSRVIDSNIRVKNQGLLESIVSAVVDQFHEYEAKIANTTQGRNLKELSAYEGKEVKGFSTYRMACSSVLCAFACLDASLVTPHCRALAPTLKGVGMGHSSESDLVCAQRILKTLELGLAELRDADTSFLEEVMHDVDAIMCQSPVSALEEASVRCLCVITKKAGTDGAIELITRAASTFKTYLQQYQDELRQYCTTKMPSKVTGLERNARGAMVRLGLLTRFGDFDEEFIEEAYNTLEATCHIVCVRNTRDTLAKAAIRALSHLLIRHRSILSRGTGLLLDIMKAPKSSDDVLSCSLDGSELTEVLTFAEGIKLCVFQGFNELLRDEEERNSVSKPNDMQNGSVNGKPESIKLENAKGNKDARSSEFSNGVSQAPSKPVLAAEEDAEAGFLALSAQSMMPAVQMAVQSTSLQVRRTVANILGLIVRQGLVLPATVVPTLFCLLLDQDARCRDCAFRVVLFLSDRYSDMLASTVLRSLRICFEPSFFVRYTALPILHNTIESTRDTRTDQTQDSYRGPQCRAATAEEICNLSTDSRSGQSLLSQAIMSMRRDQRRGVLENIMREFDPRASTRVASQQGNGNEVRIDGEHVNVDRSLGALNNGVQEEQTPVRALNDDVDDDDDDIGDVSGQDLELQVSDKLCPLPVLHFLAITLATVDYSNGAGVGGSLTQGGGTAAADTKLKHAREDVTELIGIATRIISNSGQAILRVAKQLRMRNSPRPQSKRQAALCASRISMLLQLKHHLKVVRWRPVADTDGSKEEVDTTASVFKIPQLHLGGSPLELAAEQSSKEHLSQLAEEQLLFFEKLMREDAIDESDIAAPSRRWSRVGTSVRRKGSMRTGTGKRSRTKKDSQKDTVPRRERLQRRASASRPVKRLRYDDESEDDGSDFDPNKL